jgi:hypothetical protein
VGAVARPRVRPLVEVLSEVAPAPAPPPPDVAEPDPDQQRLDLDHLARAVRPVAARLLTAVVEVLDARRPVAHLAARADATVLAALATARARPRRPEGRLHGLRVSPVTPRAVEVAAVVVRDKRAQAVAARLEHAIDAPEGTWRITVLVLV